MTLGEVGRSLQCVRLASKKAHPADWVHVHTPHCVNQHSSHIAMATPSSLSGPSLAPHGSPGRTSPRPFPGSLFLTQHSPPELEGRALDSVPLEPTGHLSFLLTQALLSCLWTKSALSWGCCSDGSPSPSFAESSHAPQASRLLSVVLWGLVTFVFKLCEGRNSVP